MITEDIIKILDRIDRRVRQLEAAEIASISMPWNPANALMPYAANATIGYFLRLQDYAYFHRFRCMTDVSGVSTGANYWTIILKETGTGIGLASFTTAADTGNVDTYHEVTSVTQPTVGRYMYQVDVTKTGAPGNLYIVPSLWGMIKT